MTESEAKEIAEVIAINVECEDCGYYVMEALDVAFPEHAESFWNAYHEAFGR